MSRRIIIIVSFVFIMCASSIGFVMFYNPQSNLDENQIMIEDEKVALGAESDYNAYVNLLVQGKGTIEVSPYKASYQAGKKVFLTAHAKEGWKFEYWSGDVPLKTANNENITIILPEGKFLAVAVFVQE